AEQQPVHPVAQPIERRRKAPIGEVEQPVVSAPAVALDQPPGGVVAKPRRRERLHVENLDPCRWILVAQGGRDGARRRAVSAAAALAALLPIARLELHTDMAELLPEDHPAVAALRRVTERQRGAISVIVLVESEDAGSARRFADALRPALEALVPRLFTEVRF